MGKKEKKRKNIKQLYTNIIIIIIIYFFKSNILHKYSLFSYPPYSPPTFLDQQHKKKLRIASRHLFYIL